MLSAVQRELPSAFRMSTNTSNEGSVGGPESRGNLAFTVSAQSPGEYSVRGRRTGGETYCQ